MEKLPPRESTLYQHGAQLFEQALRESAAAVQHGRLSDGRAVEVLEYRASPAVKVQLCRPDTDTEEISAYDTEESGSSIKMEMSIVCERRFRIRLANNEWYANNRFHIGIYEDGVFLLRPSVAVNAQGVTFIDGWHQSPVHQDSEGWLQDLITPIPQQL